MKKLLLVVCAMAMLSLPHTTTAQEQRAHTLTERQAIERRQANYDKFVEAMETKVANHLYYNEFLKGKWKNYAALDSTKPFLRFHPHQLILVVYEGAEWNKGELTISNMDQFNLPVGSKIIECQDQWTVPQGIDIFKTGYVRGTAFTVLLPDYVKAWEVTEGKFGKRFPQGYFNLDQFTIPFSGPAPTVNDPNYAGAQPHLNGNNANVIFDNLNMGWGWLQAYVPRGGYTQKIGVIGTGYLLTLTDVNASKVSPNSYNFGYNNYDVTDSNGHETEVTGNIACIPNNLTGNAGINPHDSILVLKVNTGTGFNPTTSTIISAYNYGLSKGMTMSNMSFGSYIYDGTFASAVATGFTTYNCWPFAASDNAGGFSNSVYPACFAHVITIVGMTYSGSVWTSSTSTDSADYAFMALNVRVMRINATFTNGNGNSYACPQAVAYFAIIRNMYPEKTMAQAKLFVDSLCTNFTSPSSSLGRGFPIDSNLKKKLHRDVLKQDTLTKAYCSGKFKICETPRFKVLDSGFIGTNAVTATLTGVDTANANLIMPGTYTVTKWVKFIPEDIPSYTTAFYDTVVQTIIIPGPFTGTNAATSMTVTPGTSVCTGTMVTATKAGNTTAAKRKWYKNGVFVDTTASISYTTVGVGNDTIMLITDLSTTGTCWNKAFDTSTTIITKIATVVPTISIALTTNDTLCQSGTFAFTSSATNPGTSPTYQWMKYSGSWSNIVGATSATLSQPANTLMSVDSIKLMMTSNATCPLPATVYSAPVYIHVNADTTVIVSITPSSATICSVGDSVVITSSLTNPITGATYQWYKGASPVGSGLDTIHVKGALAAGTYSLVVTAPGTGCYTPPGIDTCNTPSVITVNAATVVPPSTASATTTALCNENADTLNSSCSIVGATPQWQKKTGVVFNNIPGATSAQHILSAGLTPGTNEFRCIWTMPAGCYTKPKDTSNVVTIVSTAPGTPPAITCTAGTPFMVTGGQYACTYTFAGGVPPYKVYGRTTTGSWTYLGLSTGSTYTWNPMPVSADSVYGTYSPSGCYDPDSSISNVAFAQNPLGVAAPTIEALGVKIYPNPSTGVFNITHLPKDFTIQIKSIDGRTLVNQTGGADQTVDMTGYPSGVYMLYLVSPEHEKIVPAKLLKQ